MSGKATITPVESLATGTITKHIVTMRNHKVLLDADLAELYGVQTKVLVQAVKRNVDRFPGDFMFQLDAEEWKILRSQSVTSSVKHSGRRYPPFAFTEQGVAMLSSVLGSAQAIAGNIEIMRAFVRLREITITATNDILLAICSIPYLVAQLLWFQQTTCQNQNTPSVVKIRQVLIKKAIQKIY